MGLVASAREGSDQAGISVIICAYNSATKLPITLEHLSKQRLPQGYSWELVLVDNNSTDDTISVASDTWADLGAPVPITIIQEPTQGLTHARFAGIRHCRFEYIVFCDDDNWLTQSYLAHAAKTLREFPDVGVVGGWSEAVTDVALPVGFDSIQFAFAVGKPHQTSKDITDGWQVWGAGMATRRSLMLKVFQEDFPFLCTDRSGKLLSSGGDDEICSRVILLGFKLYFNENLYFRHFISAGRLTPNAISSLQTGFFQSNRVLKRYQFCIKGLWAYQRKDRTHAVVSALKSMACALRGNWLYGRCHLDSALFALNIPWLQDSVGRSILDYARQSGRFLRQA